MRGRVGNVGTRFASKAGEDDGKCLVVDGRDHADTVSAAVACSSMVRQVTAGCRCTISVLMAKAPNGLV